MPGPVEFFIEFGASASKPAFKIAGDPGGTKLTKTEFDKFLEARVREGAVIAPAFLRFFPVTASHITRPVLALDFSKPGGPTLTRYAPLYAAPQPIGVVPPSAVGLPPGYFGRLFPSLPKSTFLHTAQLTPAQQKEFEQRALAKKPFVGFAILLPSTGQLPDNRTFAAHLIDTIVEVREVTNEFLANQLHAPAVGGLNDVLGGSSAIGITPLTPAPQIAAAPVATPPTDAAGPFGAAPVAMGSTQPQLFQPVNQKAINNQRAATGIRKELHSERADP